MKPVQVSLEGKRYAAALWALHRAGRARHRLDAALVSARSLERENVDLEAAWEALGTLERQLACLEELLTKQG